MAGYRSVAGAADGGKKVTAFGPMSGLRYAPDGTAIVDPPRTTAPGTSYEDEVFKQLFDTKSPTRAQKTRKLNPQTGTYVAGTSEDTLRNRPDFILQGMLSADPNERLLIKRLWDRADKDQKKILAQEIAEAFPDAQGQAPGGSPMYREIMSFLRTGEISPERMEILRQEADLANSDPRVRRQVDDLPPGNPDRAAVTEDMSGLDTEIQFEPDSKVPGDPLLDAGPRAFEPPEGVDTTHLRTEMDARPYLRAPEVSSVRGDKINPKKERFDTGMVEGAVEPTPEEIAAQRKATLLRLYNDTSADLGISAVASDAISLEQLEAWAKSLDVLPLTPEDLAQKKRNHLEWNLVSRGLMPESMKGRLDVSFMESVLRNRGIDPTFEPLGPAIDLDLSQLEPPARRQMPVRVPQGVGTIGPQDAGRILAGEKYEKADAARVAGMEQALAEEFGMDIEDVREQFRRLQEAGDADSLKDMQARAKIAIKRADLGPKPKVPYDSANNQSDIRAASSVAEGGEQRMLADALDQLGRGQLGGEDRVFRMLLKKASRDLVASPAQAGLPTAEAMTDYALSLIRNPDVLGRIAANKGYATWRQQIVDALDNRFYRQDQPPRVLTKEEASAEDAASGRELKGDPFPQGIDQYGRPVSAIEGRNPTAGRKNPGHVNSPVDRYPGSEGLENLSDAAENIGTRRVTGVPISPEPDTGILSAQASALENSIGYANQRGKVVWQDPETGNILAAYITPKMKPERVAEIRENARALATSTGEVFDYYWPEGGLPRPDFHRWNLGDAPDAVPEGYVPPSATVPPRDMSPVEPMPPATPRPYADVPASTLKQAEGLSQELGASMTEDGPLPPGVRMGLDGRYYRSAFEGKPGLFADEADPNSMLDEATAVMGEMPPGAGRRAMDEDTSEAWKNQGRTVLDADGNEIPLEAAAAEDLAQEVARILSDPDASPEDLQWAMGIGRDLQRGYDRLPEPIKTSYKQDVLDPIEQAAAARRAQPDDPEPTEIGADLPDEVSDNVVATDSEMVFDDLPREESATSVLAVDGANESRDIFDLGANSVEEESGPVVYSPMPDPEASVISPEAAGVPNDVDDKLNAAAAPVDEQPSVQSADNRDPQQPPRDVEDEARQNANAQKQPSDVEATEADAATQADAAANPTPTPAPNPNPSPAPAPTPSPTQGKSWWQGTKDHFYNNRVRYGLAAAATPFAMSLYNARVTSDPYPNALDPVAGGPDEDPMESMSPEDRIRMLIQSGRSKAKNSNPYPAQTLWRQY